MSRENVERIKAGFAAHNRGDLPRASHHGRPNCSSVFEASQSRGTISSPPRHLTKPNSSANMLRSLLEDLLQDRLRLIQTAEFH